MLSTDPTPMDRLGDLSWLGGAVCTAATGMGSFVGQDRINWTCDDSHLLIGQVDRTGQPWTVLGLLESESSARPLAIEKAWF
jgi:hypothetical protein